MTKIALLKAILKEMKTANNWYELKAIYNKYDVSSQFGSENDFSPFYNKLTSHYQKMKLRSFEIGEKDTLYFDEKENKVITWTGKRCGKILKTSYYTSYGYSITERVSITFEVYGKIFRGICSYKNMQCFNVKRVA